MKEQESAGSNTNQGMYAAKSTAKSSQDALNQLIQDQNMSEDDIDKKWREHWTLPRNYNGKRTYFDKISTDKEIKSKTKSILEGVEQIKLSLEEDKQYWSKPEFKQFYNMRKGMKRILASKDALDNDPLSRYKYYIENVFDNISQIKKELMQKPVYFIQFDYSKLMETFFEYGQEYINNIYQLIVDDAREDLNSLYQLFEETAEELKTPSTELHHLKKNKELYKKITDDLPKYQARLEPIKVKFQYLEEKEQDHALTEDEQNKLRGLNEAWKKFNDALNDANQVINRSQRQLKQYVDSQNDDFKRRVEEKKREFETNAPFLVDKNADNENIKARELLDKFRLEASELREIEDTNKFGLEIFLMDPIVYPQLSQIEKESQLLEDVWSLKIEWDTDWDGWKIDNYKKLDIQDLDDKALYYLDKLKEFPREI